MYIYRTWSNNESSSFILFSLLKKNPTTQAHLPPISMGVEGASCNLVCSNLAVPTLDVHIHSLKCKSAENTNNLEGYTNQIILSSLEKLNIRPWSSFSRSAPGKVSIGDVLNSREETSKDMSGLVIKSSKAGLLPKSAAKRSGGSRGRSSLSAKQPQIRKIAQSNLLVEKDMILNNSIK
jgi:hypothetical protein